MKKILAPVLAVLMLFNLSGCYDVEEISYTVAAIAVGIDKGENSKYRVSFHIEKAGSNEGEEEDSEGNKENKKGGLITVEAPTVSSAYEMVNDLSSVHVSIDNLKMVLLSAQISKDGIYPVISELMCDMNLKNNAYVAVTDEDADTVMENIVPEDEEYLSSFYQRILYNRYKAETKYFLIEEVYFNMLSFPGQDIMLPLARLKKANVPQSRLRSGILPESENYEVEFSGGAAFSGGSLSGFFSDDDMMAASLLYGDFKTEKISFEYPEGSGEYIIVQLAQQKRPEKRTKIKEGRIYDDAVICLSATYLFADEGESFGEFTPGFEKYLKNEIKTLCEEFIKRSVYIYGADTLSIGKRLKKCFLTNGEFAAFYKKEKVLSAEINVDVRLDIKSGGRFVFK